MRGDSQTTAAWQTQVITALTNMLEEVCCSSRLACGGQIHPLSIQTGTPPQITKFTGVFFFSEVLMSTQTGAVPFGGNLSF